MSAVTPDPEGDLAWSYRVVGFGALVPTGFMLMERAQGAPTALLALLPAGLGMVFHRPGLPVVSLLALTYFLTFPTGVPFFNPPTEPVGRSHFNLVEAILLAGFLAATAAQWRLFGLKRQALARDASPSGRLHAKAAPVPRPEGETRTDELTRLAAGVGAAVVAGQAAWWLVTAFRVAPAEFPPLAFQSRSGLAGNDATSRFVLAATLAALVVGGVRLWGWAAALGRLRQDEARLFLLDVAWAEGRRELARQETWRAWATARRDRRNRPKPPRPPRGWRSVARTGALLLIALAAVAWALVRVVNLLPDNE